MNPVTFVLVGFAAGAGIGFAMASIFFTPTMDNMREALEQSNEAISAATSAMVLQNRTIILQAETIDKQDAALTACMKDVP